MIRTICSALRSLPAAKLRQLHTQGLAAMIAAEVGRSIPWPAICLWSKLLESIGSGCRTAQKTLERCSKNENGWSVKQDSHNEVIWWTKEMFSQQLGWNCSMCDNEPITVCGAVYDEPSNDFQIMLGSVLYCTCNSTVPINRRQAPPPLYYIYIYMYLS